MLRAVLVLPCVILEFLGCCVFLPKVAARGLFQIYSHPHSEGLCGLDCQFINAHRVSQPSSLKCDCLT